MDYLFVAEREDAIKDGDVNPIPGADKFNGDLSKWDVLDVISMVGMFQYAKSFNSDLSKWDVSSVTNMAKMFKGASSFTGTLCGAWVTVAADKDAMFEGSLGRLCRKTL